MPDVLIFDAAGSRASGPYRIVIDLDRTSGRWRYQVDAGQLGTHTEEGIETMAAAIARAGSCAIRLGEVAAERARIVGPGGPPAG